MSHGDEREREDVDGGSTSLPYTGRTEEDRGGSPPISVLSE